ncbi:universal stress protein [Rhodobaculum claviforme]|nr:universal stress protein [Rhodobaculum claviforme]
MATGTIIAASDLTPLSREVAGRALALGRRMSARVILVHALPDGTSEARVQAAREALEQALAAAGGSGAGPGGAPPQPSPRAEVRVLTGPPDIAIRSVCLAEGGVLVLLGLHRFRRVLDMLRLTTMERIVLRAPVPVLIAHTPVTRDYGTVLASTDFAPACAAALAAAARVASPGAQFHAIHALQLGLRDKFSHGGVSASRAMTRAEAMCRAFLAMPGVPAGLHPPEIVVGGVHEVLAFRLEELRPDLLAIGTHSGRDPETLGNYARDLMREPPTDVIVTKPPPL